MAAAKRPWTAVASRADVVLRLYDEVLSNPDLVLLILKHDAEASEGWRVASISVMAVSKDWCRLARSVDRNLEAWHTHHFSVPNFRKIHDKYADGVARDGEPQGGSGGEMVWFPPWRSAGAFTWQVGLQRPTAEKPLPDFIVRWPADRARAPYGLYARRTDLRLMVHNKDGDEAFQIGARFVFGTRSGFSCCFGPTWHTPTATDVDQMLLKDGTMRVAIKVRVTRGRRECCARFTSSGLKLRRHHPMWRDAEPAPKHTYYYCDRCGVSRPSLSTPEPWPALWRCVAGCNFDLCDACHDLVENPPADDAPA